MGRCISIIIPCKDDGPSLYSLLREISENRTSFISASEHEILIVDESYEPESIKLIEIIRQEFNELNIRIIKVPRGYGLLLSEALGLREARYPVKIVMDGDMQHNPLDINKIVGKLDEGFDIVIGSRFIEGGEFEGPRKRKFVSLIANLYVKLALPFTFDLADTTSGFFGISQRVCIDGCGYPEGKLLGSKTLLFILSQNSNLRKTEVPIKFRKRLYGKSKLLNISYAINFPLEILKIRKIYLYSLKFKIRANTFRLKG